MTPDVLEKLVDRVLEFARRINSDSEHAEWEFHRDGVKAAITLHIAVMQAIKEIPSSVQH